MRGKLMTETIWPQRHTFLWAWVCKDILLWRMCPKSHPFVHYMNVTPKKNLNILLEMYFTVNCPLQLITFLEVDAEMTLFNLLGSPMSCWNYSYVKTSLWITIYIGFFFVCFIRDVNYFLINFTSVVHY